MANFKIKNNDKHFNYGEGLTLFRKHIKVDLRNTVGCMGWMPYHTVVKLKTIHSKLIKIMYGE